MAQEHWQDCGKEPAKDVDVKTGKTVRFQNNTRDICDSKMTAGAVPVVPGQHQGAPGSNNPAINMVQNLVPHLPGLDKDKVYVISGERNQTQKYYNLDISIGLPLIVRYHMQ